MKSPDALLSAGIRRALGWLRWRFFNPTRDWPSRAITRLEFDVDQCRLNGIRLDAPWQELKVFGPADAIESGVTRLDGPDLSFHALGLKIESYEGRVVSAAVVTDGSARPDGRHRRMASGRLTVVGSGLPASEITKETHERDLFSMFGAPVETGPIVGEPVHTFAVKCAFVLTFHDPATGYVREVLLTERVENRQGQGPNA